MSIMACYYCYYNTVYYKAREIYNKYKAEVGWSRSLKPYSIHKLSLLLFQLQLHYGEPVQQMPEKDES